MKPAPPVTSALIRWTGRRLAVREGYPRGLPGEAPCRFTAVQLLSRLRARPELIPGVLAVGVFVAWDGAQGGYAPTALYPGAIFLLGLLVVTAIAFRAPARSVPRAAVIAFALLAAFTAWSFLSISWADAKADAWDGANRTLLYLTVFALFALPRWRASSAAIVLGAYSVGIAVLGATVVVEGMTTADPELMFNDGARLVEPMGYTNAVAALFAASFWPAIFLASRRETPWAARGVLLAAAGLFVQLAIVPQSRGAFIAFPIILALYLAIVPNRVRSVLVLVPVLAATALAAPTLLDVFTVADNRGDLGAALDRAGEAMAISALVLGVLGCALGLADRKVSIRAGTERLAGRGLAVTAAAGAIVGTILLLGVIGNPVTWTEDRWDDFKGNYEEQGPEESRFTGTLGSGRYDFYRVALGDEFASAPVVGTGADNFAVTYIRERETIEEPLYVHSLPIGILAGTGLVGAALFAGFLGSSIVAAVRNRLAGADSFTRGLSAAALVAFGYWLVHASGDWLWSIPGLTAPALAWLAIATRVVGGADPPATAPARPRSPLRLGGAAVAVAAVGFAVVTYALPWAAARDIESAESTWRSNPDAAFDRLDRARDLNFLSGEPDVVAATIAEQLGETDRVRASLRDAIEREPKNWYALLQLGALEAFEGDRAAGLAHLERAAKLNPSDTQVRLVAQRARAGRPLTLEQLRRMTVRRVCGLVGPTSESRFCR
jgi:O-Antigen ligase